MTAAQKIGIKGLFMWMMRKPWSQRAATWLRSTFNYRSVRLSKQSKQVKGLKWQFGNRTVYTEDIKLSFRLAPGIFHRLTQAVKRMLKRKGTDMHSGVFR